MIYIYIYSVCVCVCVCVRVCVCAPVYYRPISITIRVLTNTLGDKGSIPCWVIPKTQKMVLDTSLLYTQSYKKRTKQLKKMPSENSTACECTRPQRVIAAENSTACECYESTRHAGANNVTLPLLSVSVLETFLASQEFSDPRVIR